MAFFSPTRATPQFLGFGRAKRKGAMSETLGFCSANPHEIGHCSLHPKAGHAAIPWIRLSQTQGGPGREILGF